MAVWDVTTRGTRIEWDTDLGMDNSCIKIDDTHFINFSRGTDSDGFVDVFEVDLEDNSITVVSHMEFDDVSCRWNSAYKIDDTHYINFWSGTSSDGYARVFELDTDDWSVTGLGTALEFDTVNNIDNSCQQISQYRYLNFYGGDGEDGYAETFLVNSSTYAVTSTGRLEFDTAIGLMNRSGKLSDTHYVNSWKGNSHDGFVQVFAVNPSTFAVTTAGDRLEFDTVNNTSSSLVVLDATHFVIIWQQYTDAETNYLYARAFEVNNTTWAITALGDTIEVETPPNGSFPEAIKVDDTHILVTWRGEGQHGQARVIEIDVDDDYQTSLVGTQLEYDDDNTYWQSLASMGDGLFFMTWSGAGSDGFAQVLGVELPSSSTNASLERSLHIQGKLSSTLDRSLYLGGSISSTLDRSLWVWGKLDNHLVRDLWVEGKFAPTSSELERGFYIAGASLGSVERGLYLEGVDYSFVDRGLYLHGEGGSFVDKNLWIQGSLSNSLDRGLWVNGQSVRVDRSLWITGKIDGSLERGLYIAGVSESFVERSLWIGGSLSSELERGLYIEGSIDGDLERGLYIGGIGTGSLERGLRVEGYVSGGGSVERSLWVGVFDIDSFERNLYLEGVSADQLNINLYIEGMGGSFEERSLYIRGGSSSSLERSLWVNSKLGGSVEVGLYIQGLEASSVERGLYLEGELEVVVVERGLWVQGYRESSGDFVLKVYNGTEWVQIT